ncbi:hypothetical protein N431DRAFT_4873 [Stipitochalara longipes BDJ]|nr:hypothetical protein N431DRAFT_4873 [Stipitochalara longipes BDJ]
MRYRKRNTGGSFQQAGYFTTDWVQTPTSTSYGCWAAAGTVIGGAESAGTLASHLSKLAPSALTAAGPHHREEARAANSVASSRKRWAGAVIDFFLAAREEDFQICRSSLAWDQACLALPCLVGPSVMARPGWRLENGDASAAPNLQRALAVGLID